MNQCIYQINIDAIQICIDDQMPIDKNEIIEFFESRNIAMKFIAIDQIAYLKGKK